MGAAREEAVGLRSWRQVTSYLGYGLGYAAGRRHRHETTAYSNTRPTPTRARENDGRRDHGRSWGGCLRAGVPLPGRRRVRQSLPTQQLLPPPPSAACKVP